MGFRKKLADEKATGYKYVSMTSIRKKARAGLKKGEKWRPRLTLEQPGLDADAVLGHAHSIDGTRFKCVRIVWTRRDGVPLEFNPTGPYPFWTPKEYAHRLSEWKADRGWRDGFENMDEFQRFRQAVRDRKLWFTDPQIATTVDGRTYPYFINLLNYPNYPEANAPDPLYPFHVKMFLRRVGY